MQVEFPPVKVVGKERVIVCATVAGVGEHIVAAFGEAKEDVTGRRINSSFTIDSGVFF